MERQIPQRNYFDKAEKIKKTNDIVLLLSGILSLITVFDISKIKAPFQNIIVSCADVILPVVLIILAFIAFVLKCYFDKNYQSAELIRRESLIDNSFATKILPETSVGYYDNEDILWGMKKLLANFHQGAFYTYKILEKMSYRESVINGVAAIITLIIAFSNMRRSLVLFAIQLLLSGEFGGHYVSFIRLKQNVKNVNEKCTALWSKIEETGGSVTDTICGEIIALALEYETALAYGSLMLDSKKYEEHRIDFDNQWVELQHRYNINPESKCGRDSSTS